MSKCKKIIKISFFNSIKLLLFSTEVSHMFSTEMSSSRDVLIPNQAVHHVLDERKDAVLLPNCFYFYFLRCSITRDDYTLARADKVKNSKLINFDKITTFIIHCT